MATEMDAATLLDIQTDFAPIVATLTGLRAQFTELGWTQEHAEEAALVIFKHSIDTAKT